MLRITTHDDGTTVRLDLEGRLVKAWVIEAEHAWRAARIEGRPLRVDLNAVTSIDDDGWRLLRGMKEAGAVFIAEGVGMKRLIKDMTSGNARTRPRRPSRFVCALALAMSSGVFGVTVNAQTTATPPMRVTLNDAVTLAHHPNQQVAHRSLGVDMHDVTRRAGESAPIKAAPQCNSR